MKIGIVGLGTIGSKLIEYLPQKGFQVIAYTHRNIESHAGIFEKSIEKKVKYEKLDYEFIGTMKSRVEFSQSIAAIHDCDLIIECVKEDYEIKKGVLRDIFNSVDSDANVVSTTSSLDLFRLVDPKERYRFCGMHFFNPPTKMRLIELSFLSENTTDFRTAIYRFLNSLDDKKIIELPCIQGFVVNRLLFAYLNHAMNYVASEKVAVQDVDDAMKLGTNAPMGPFELMDYIGIDVTLQILNTLHGDLGNENYRANAMLEEMLKRNELGRKTGKGFYAYQ
ncbi:MAG TPA: 3-hydroxyacyl-CoA dehydrogenase family protein [Spirochaetales bacterium]|nr:3-hydroxyacyl-CoA dehydrogenase family protein [Spirochaetales bacterium]HRY53128.1 3-hydroxyacyl-CoA dehydrogenase family protein [Spirochaetia bacterium]